MEYEGSREARLSSVEALARELEQRFGKQVLYRLTQARPRLGERVVPSGSLALDEATHLGGVPRGHLTALVGPESSGKTTLAYHLLASAQRDGGLAALIDGEQATAPNVLAACGVDVDDLILATPTDVGEALVMADLLDRCGALDGLVVAGLLRVTPRALVRLRVGVRGGPTATLFVLPRDQLDREPPGPFDLVVTLAPLRPLYGPGGDVLGFRTRAEVTRSRLARPGGWAALQVRLGGGLDRAAEALELGLAHGLIERVGGLLVWCGRPLGRNAPQAGRLLERDADLRAALLGALAGHLATAGLEATA